MADILHGKIYAARILRDVHRANTFFRQKTGRPAALRVLLVGDDPPSRLYVSLKRKKCLEMGLESDVQILPPSASAAAILAAIARANGEETLDGLLVQLPLPAGISVDSVMAAIDPLKDVDGFHPDNVRLLEAGRPSLAPATPLGCMFLLKALGFGSFAGRKVFVIGRSPIVGRPLRIMLEHKGAEVFVGHSRRSYEEMARFGQAAEILISACGRPDFVGADFVRPQAVVLDVGTTKVDGKIRGDVRFAEVLDKVRAITPVPGGIGPMTIAMLLWNTLRAAFVRHGLALEGFFEEIL